MEETCLRIKLIFHGGILSDSQKSEGFKKTWLLLKPQHHRTISDLCSHILQLFHLHESCPDGLLLYMDEFVLPPFESTSILKNKDVISVKRKPVTSTIECYDVPVNAGPLLLANEEFNKETGGYESEEPEDDGKIQVHDTSPLKDKLGGDGVSKKRKASEKLHSSKKKKKCSEVEEPDIDVQVEHAKKLQLVVTGKKSKHKKQKISDSKEKDNVKMSEDNVTTPVTNKNDKLQETEKDNVDATPKLEETPKRRSRSARRKSAKRQWLREMAKIQKTSTDSQSEALRNWKEMQSKSGREEAAGQPNGHMTNADSRSEALRNWKEMRSKPGREVAAGQSNGHKTNADSRSEAIRNWKEMQSKAGREETVCQSNRHQNWKWGQASVSTEEGVNQPNGCQGQARVKSGHGVSPQKGHKTWKQGQARAKSGEGVSLGHQGQSTSESRETSDQPRGLLNWNELLANDMVKDAEKHTQSDTNNNSCDNPNQNGDSEDETEVVPVEIRPGHIRFEPLGKERTVEQNQLNMFCSQENFRWNGITSKKKGQKWGTEKSSFSPRSELNGSNREQSGMPNDEKKTHSNEPFDFTKTPFLSSYPKEGDVIAYRLLELSSTWTPELSCYQVGEVSSYDSQSGRVSLMPVPEFPISSKKSDGDESPVQPNDSLYKEDGSLEIDFSSLVEVRILEHKTRVPGSSSECVFGDSLTVLTGTNDMQTTASIPENRDLIHGNEQRHSSSKENGVNLWEQFSETLNAKKEQLSKESNWGNGGSSGKSWSYKALRGSALGPTMAFLRSKNQL
ncbi:coilin-like isoform X5 [Ipomoea triloba]|uniref:coilin-like isoform X5 n=1 Tax=Ipomoea triloba TaxID=35885 RepID=UPI00125D79B3|nr:coilin-like isoform X5 [Ipomoea triloba]